MKGTIYHDFLKKLKHPDKAPSIAILFLADVYIPVFQYIQVYISVSLMKQVRNLCIRSWRKDWKRKFRRKILVNMVEITMKDNYFEFDSNVKKRISGTAIVINLLTRILASL